MNEKKVSGFGFRVSGVRGRFHPRPYTLNPALIAALAILCGALTGSPSEGGIVDRVVAVINDDVITLTEVQEEGLPTIRRIVQGTLGGERERRRRSPEREVL